MLIGAHSHTAVISHDRHVFLFDRFLLRVAIVPCLHLSKSFHPGATGKGTPELCGVSGQEWKKLKKCMQPCILWIWSLAGRVDIINSTLGKAPWTLILEQFYCSFLKGCLSPDLSIKPKRFFARHLVVQQAVLCLVQHNATAFHSQRSFVWLWTMRLCSFLKWTCAWHPELHHCFVHRWLHYRTQGALCQLHVTFNSFYHFTIYHFLCLISEIFSSRCSLTS